MRANKANLMQFLRRAGQLEVPVYQRRYSWGEKQCAQLWDDIVSLAQNDSIQNHFLGVIVYVEKSLNQISSTNTAYLIDGQQRLTTLSLLIAAMVKNLENTTPKNELTRQKMQKRFLFNLEEEGDLRYKINLNKEDAETFVAIVEGNDEMPYDFSYNIVQNYNFFVEKIAEGTITVSQLFNSLLKLEIIDVSLQRDLDNAQLIFDSLNSTGLGLTQIDQIRNYILMGLEKSRQEVIFNNYWTPMEQAFREKGTLNLFEMFLCDYLTIQNSGNIVNIENVYGEFNKFFNERLKFQSRENIIKHIYRYSKYYLKLTYNDIEDESLREEISKINEQNASDSYPFLMEVFEDYENELLDKTLLLEILKTVNRFISDRKSESPNKITKTFASLSKDINKMLAMKEFTPKIVDKTEHNSSPTIKDLIKAVG